MSQINPNWLSELEVENIIREWINQRQPMAVLFVRLMHYTAYQAEYGWAQTDTVLHMLSQTLTDSISTVHDQAYCVARLFSGEFVVVCSPQYAVPIAQTVIDRFDHAVPAYYSAEAQQHSCVLDAVDRRGNPYRSPAISVGIAIVSSEQRALEHPIQIEAVADEVMRYIELLPGSRYVFDRRKK